MGHRINERNSGTWSLESEPKTRKSKKQPLSNEEKRLCLIALRLVHESLEYDPDLSEHGHLHPEARFSDGGRFLANFSRTSTESIFSAIEKLASDGW